MSDSENDPKPLNTKIAEWLGAQGYQLEYRTAHALRDAGLHATLGYHIENKEGVRREIDVLAVKARFPPSTPACMGYVVCECKYSREPWVLMHGPPFAPDTDKDWRLLPKSSAALQHDPHVLGGHRDFLKQTWHFEPRQQFAHALIQALGNKAGQKNDNRDRAYDSLRKVTDAAWDMALKPPSTLGASPYAIVFPALIVDGPLVEATFDTASGEFVISDVRYGRLAWLGCRDGTVVDVVQADSLAAYAKDLANTLRLVPEMLYRLASRP